MRKTVMTIMVATSVMWAGGTVKPLFGKARASKVCKTPKVYVDRARGLMWQDAPYTSEEERAFHRHRSFGKAGTHAYAVRYCANLDYAGYRDWRLPSADELADRHREPGDQFTYTADGDFWTVTPAERGRFYVIYPADAYRYKRVPSRSNYIRCVRCIRAER